MTSSDRRLSGTVAIVTGAARGIGAATARLFVENGANVLLVDRRVELGDALAGQLAESGPGRAVFVEADVSDESGWNAIIAALDGLGGGVDVLVNCAGIIRVAPIESLDVDMFRKVIDTNVIGTFLGIKAVVPSMKVRGGGSIINFSSPQGIEGREGFSAYASSKFAIRGLTRCAAIEFGEFGIRVNDVVPGPTRTAMTERQGWTEEDYGAAYDGYPLGRMGDPSEVAAMCLFLAGSESSFCTGSDFVVDGGVLAGKPRSR